MIFAIYKANTPDACHGDFIPGKLYLASPEVNAHSVVDVEHLIMQNEGGERVWVDPDAECFDYPEEVYAVVLRAVGIHHPGKVVVIDCADDDGDFLSVKGLGFVRSSFFQLLDTTLVRPGMLVYDRESCQWRSVMRVDECMRMSIDGDEMRDPTSFTFAIVDKELSLMPLSRIRAGVSVAGTTPGSVYPVLGIDEHGDVIVSVDSSEMVLSPDVLMFV